MALGAGSNDGMLRVQRLQLFKVTRTRREELGRGSYAAVFEVMVQGTPCAAKEVHPILMSARSRENFYAECIRSSQLLHPNIVQFIGIYYPNPNADLPWLVMELMYTNVTGFVEQRGKEKKDIPLHFKMSILVDACQGLRFLHSKNIAHRDLSSNNILLTKHFVAKIGDLGMAKVIMGDSQRHTMAPGTQVFMPPEALAGNETTYGVTIDVFSLGCVCLHVISMQWPAPKPMKLLDNKTGKVFALTELERREKYLKKFQQFPTLEILVGQCLDDFPGKRPAVVKVLEGLRSGQPNPVSHENHNVIQLHDHIANYKRLLDQKDKELAEMSKQVECKQTELTKKITGLESMQMEMTEQLKQLQSQLISTREELTEAMDQLIVKDTLLAKSQQQIDELQSQLLVAIKERDSQEELVDNVVLSTVAMIAEQLQCDEAVSDEEATDDIVVEGVAAVGADNDTSNQPDDKALDDDDDGLEEGEVDSEDDGGRKRYGRDFLLSLQFLEYCRQRPPNLVNAEYIRKLPRQSDIRFDPGYYDGPSRGRKKIGYQGNKKKIELPSKEQVELRKAEKRWVRPVEAEADLTNTEKETQHPHQLAAVPTQQMYLPQQQPPAGHYNVTGPGFAPYQPYANVAQPQIIRQQYTGPQSHHYPQAGQIMPMNTVTGAAGTNAAIPPGIMPDNSAILAATTQPHMHYMPNTPTMLPQQPQQHHMQPLAPAAAAKQSKAIKIVNPETMKEVDTSNLKKTSPASSARSTPKPNSESEQVQQQFKQTVNRAVDLKGNDVAKQPAVTPNAIIRQPKIPKTDSNEFRKLSLAPAKLRPGGQSAATVDKGIRQESKSKPSQSSGSKRSDSRSGSISASGSGSMTGSGQSRRSFASVASDNQKERKQTLELTINLPRSSGSSRSSSSKEAENAVKRLDPDVLSE